MILHGRDAKNVRGVGHEQEEVHEDQICIVVVEAPLTVDHKYAVAVLQELFSLYPRAYRYQVDWTSSLWHLPFSGNKIHKILSGLFLECIEQHFRFMQENEGFKKRTISNFMKHIKIDLTN